jgi:hypothetical protein
MFPVTYSTTNSNRFAGRQSPTQVDVPWIRVVNFGRTRERRKQKKDRIMKLLDVMYMPKYISELCIAIPLMLSRACMRETAGIGQRHARSTLRVGEGVKTTPAHSQFGPIMSYQPHSLTSSLPSSLPPRPLRHKLDINAKHMQARTSPTPGVHGYRRRRMYVLGTMSRCCTPVDGEPFFPLSFFPLPMFRIMSGPVFWCRSECDTECSTCPMATVARWDGGGRSRGWHQASVTPVIRNALIVPENEGVTLDQCVVLHSMCCTQLNLPHIKRSVSTPSCISSWRWH